MRNSLRWILKESVQREFRAAETEEGKYGSFSTDYQFVEVPFVIHTYHRYLIGRISMQMNKKIII